MKSKKVQRRGDPFVCLCNQVARSEIEAAMAAGADSMAKLFDATFAGCGPCGGSCQPDLVRMLTEFHARRSAGRPGG